MIYLEMKPGAVLLTVCQGKTRNKTFTNMSTLFYDFKKIYIRCLSSKICLTKNCPCRYEVFTGHRRYASTGSGMSVRSTWHSSKAHVFC